MFPRKLCRRRGNIDNKTRLGSGLAVAHLGSELILLAWRAPRHHRHTPFPGCGLVRGKAGRLCSADSLAGRNSAFRGATSLLMDSSSNGHGWTQLGLDPLVRIIHECRHEAFETEARRGFSQVRLTQAYVQSVKEAEREKPRWARGSDDVAGIHE